MPKQLGVINTKRREQILATLHANGPIVTQGAHQYIAAFKAAGLDFDAEYIAGVRAGDANYPKSNYAACIRALQDEGRLVVVREESYDNPKVALIVEVYTPEQARAAGVDSHTRENRRRAATKARAIAKTERDALRAAEQKASDALKATKAIEAAEVLARKAGFGGPVATPTPGTIDTVAFFHECVAELSRRERLIEDLRVQVQSLEIEVAEAKDQIQVLEEAATKPEVSTDANGLSSSVARHPAGAPHEVGVPVPPLRRI